LQKNSIGNMRGDSTGAKTHIALVGDSIFDNSAYVPGQPAVIDQLRSILPDRSTATLLAKDGSITAEVVEQLRSLPKDVTHLVIGSGGNDALRASGTLTVGGAAEEFLEELVSIQKEFRKEYRRLLNACNKVGKRTIVSTIYDSIPTLEAWLRTALSVFNDVIIREAATLGFPVIDLRPLCNEDADYSTISSIEPSSKGRHEDCKEDCGCCSNV
jgi:hypothetical protein